MTINSVITNLCWQFGKVTHTDKMLADKCRLISAILGQGWERVDRENKNNDEEKTREECGTTLIMTSQEWNSMVEISWGRKMIHSGMSAAQRIPQDKGTHLVSGK